MDGHGQVSSKIKTIFDHNLNYKINICEAPLVKIKKDCTNTWLFPLEEVENHLPLLRMSFA